jgi:hypothetical protein
MSICLLRREFVAALGGAAGDALSMVDEVIEWAGWTA